MVCSFFRFKKQQHTFWLGEVEEHEARPTQPKTKEWKGLEDGESWQRGYLKAGSTALREIDFWVGE